MDNSITPEQSIMLCMAAMYIALTEAISTTFGRDIEPLANHLLEGMRPHLPDEAADMCSYLLEFSTPRSSAPPRANFASWLGGDVRVLN
jgi:hypothetical protein